MFSLISSQVFENDTGKICSLRMEKGQKAGFLCQVRLKIPLTKKKGRKNSKSEERERR